MVLREVGEGSMGRAGCGEMRQEKRGEGGGGGNVFADPLSGASAPDPPFPRSPAALSRAHHHLQLHPPLKRARMVWGRAAGGARQIRELHCQAGMIYLTNISI